GKPTVRVLDAGVSTISKILVHVEEGRRVRQASLADAAEVDQGRQRRLMARQRNVISERRDVPPWDGVHQLPTLVLAKEVLGDSMREDLGHRVLKGVLDGGDSWVVGIER